MLPVDIPDKLFFKIGEVSHITGLKPHVLRYWESEFSAIRPTKSRANQRVYQRKDIEAILLIKQLLYAEKFTIEGARTRLKELRHNKEEQRELLKRGQSNQESALESIRDRLVKIRDLLDKI